MMMKPNSEIKTSTTMNTQSTQREEIFHDSFFIRRSVISDIVKRTHKAGTDETRENTGGKQNGNSFMKKFLGKSLVLAIAVVIANLFFVQNASAQITQTVAWAKAYDQATLSATGISFAIPGGSNRILVVGIASTMTSSGNATFGDPTTISYGGVTLTKATGNGGSTGRMHTWLYFLKDNAIMDNTSRPIDVTLPPPSANTAANLTVWYAVFAGVDQAPAYYTVGNAFTNATGGSGPAQLTSAMTINANEQAVYISSIFNFNNSIVPTYTINANWTSGGNNTGTTDGVMAWTNEVAKRTIPGSNTADVAQTSPVAPGGGIRYAMSAMSLPKSPAPVLAITGTTNHGSSCVGTPATTITYTITNTGGSAAGITVTSNNSQFVVSNLSSTTINGGGGTATYQVTFTPGSTGAQNATITVASTTSGSNSPTSSLTGSGNPLPSASATKNDAQCFNTNTGQIVITGAGGSGSGYTYSIFNGIAHPAAILPDYPGGLADYQASNTFTHLPTGSYQIRVKDSNGCESRSVH